MLFFSKKIVSVFQNLRFRQVKPMLLHCKRAAFALQNNSFCNAVSVLCITFIVCFANILCMFCCTNIPSMDAKVLLLKGYVCTPILRLFANNIFVVRKIRLLAIVSRFVFNKFGFCLCIINKAGRLIGVVGFCC